MHGTDFTAPPICVAIEYSAGSVPVGLSHLIFRFLLFAFSRLPFVWALLIIIDFNLQLFLSDKHLMIALPEKRVSSN